MISGCLKIVVFLLLCHRTPLLLAPIVLPHVVVFGADDKDEVKRHDPEQDLVSAAIEWLILVLIDL